MPQDPGARKIPLALPWAAPSRPCRTSVLSHKHVSICLQADGLRFGAKKCTRRAVSFMLNDSVYRIDNLMFSVRSAEEALWQGKHFSRSADRAVEAADRWF